MTNRSTNEVSLSPRYGSEVITTSTVQHARGAGDGAADERTFSMTTQATRTDADQSRATLAASSAAVRLHCAELALHDAHQTHVDAWISAAADRLHDAVVLYTQTQAALATDTNAPTDTVSAA
jgi:hypothetical protein